MSEYVGGWLPELEDLDYLRDKQISDEAMLVCMAGAGVQDRPKELDPRKWSPVRNQGQEGSCQGHAITAAGEGCYHVRTGEFQPFSPDAAYYLTQQVDGIRGDRGSTISGGMKVANTVGFCPEKEMPYSDRYNPQDLPKNIKEICAPFKVSKHKLFDTSTSPFQQAFDWISLGLGFVSFGIMWNVSVDNDGYIKWNPGGGGGHANAIMGYGPLQNDGLPEYLWGKNSWGAWGPLKGWYKIKRSVMERWSQDRFTVTVGISDMENVKPRKISFVNNSVMT